METFLDWDTVSLTAAERRATRMFQFVPLGAGAEVEAAQRKFAAWLKKKEAEDRKRK